MPCKQKAGLLLKETRFFIETGLYPGIIYPTLLRLQQQQRQQQQRRLQQQP